VARIHQVLAVCIVCGFVPWSVLACGRPGTSGTTSAVAAQERPAASEYPDDSHGDSVAPPSNADLSKLESRFALVERMLAAATADGDYQLGATYCGATAGTKGAFSGPAGLKGYAVARARCQTIDGCDRTAVHMCTAEELIRTAQLSRAISDGWYSTGTYGLRIGDTDDCGGWTRDNHDGADESGPYWSGKPSASECSEWRRILCCN
jgi:hypothetical protein